MGHVSNAVFLNDPEITSRRQAILLWMKEVGPRLGWLVMEGSGTVVSVETVGEVLGLEYDVVSEESGPVFDEVGQIMGWVLDGDEAGDEAGGET
jgi:hypothetical protein